jgi:two-component system, NarL family, nitrate/nitrite response regulator NarL
MDIVSDYTDLLPNPLVADHCTEADIHSSLPVSSRSEVYTTLRGDCSVSDRFGANCRAVLVSERGLFLDGLREVLGKSRISIIGEANNIPALLDAMQTQPVPDLVICHIGFDRKAQAALDLISGLRRHFAGSKLVVLADACTTALLSSIAGSDVSAVVLTSISSNMLLQSLELVLSDHRLFPSEIMPLIGGSAQVQPWFDPAPDESATTPAESATRDHTQQSLSALSDAPAPGSQAGSRLSKREWQVLDCLLKGWANKQIAREMGIVEGTVKVYLKCLSRRLKLSNRTQLAIWALRQSHLFDADNAADPVEA